MASPWIIGFPVAIGVVVLFLDLILVFRLAHNKSAQYVREKFSGQTLLRANTRANFFGIRSAGLKQVRGNGALVLTPKELWFRRLAPAHEYSVPLTSIRAITLPEIFLGKSTGFPLLCLEFTNGDGDVDQIAFAVRKPEEWKATIEEARAKC